MLGAGGVVLSERCPHQGSNLGPGDSQWDGGSGQLDRAVRPPRWSRIRYEALVHWRALTWTFETYGPRCNADPQAHKPQADIPERCPPPDNELRGLRIPRPRSIKGNRLPPTQKSFSSAVRVIGTLPSSVRWRNPFDSGGANHIFVNGHTHLAIVQRGCVLAQPKPSHWSQYLGDRRCRSPFPWLPKIGQARPHHLTGTDR